MKFQKTILACAIGVALSTQSYGQNSAQELDLTVVESSSIERDAVIEVITIKEINDEQIDNFEDVVRYIPGVSVSKGDDRWGSSGFNIRGLDEDRVAINVDGVPQGETLKYEGGQAYGYFRGSRNSVDIEALKEIEIVKGADAILSGSGALAGAVNMTTKDPVDYLTEEGNSTGGEIKLGHSGGNDEKMASLSIANRTGKLESLLIYTRRDGNEFESYDMDALDVEGSTREIPDPRETEVESVLAKLIYNFSDTQRIGLTASYLNRDGQTDSQSFNGGWYTNRIGKDVREIKRIGFFYELMADAAIFDKMTFKLNEQSNDFEANTHQHVMFSFGPAFSADEDRVDSRAFNQDLFQITLDFEKDFALGATSHQLDYGFEIQNKDFENYQVRVSNSLLNNLGWVDRNVGGLIPKSEADIAILYALDTFTVGDNTQIRLGARYDDYTYNAMSDENYDDGTGTLGEVSFSTASWTLGLEQAFSDTLSMEVGVSTGFRAPTIEDMYSTSGDIDDWNVVANPDLEAEYSTNYDLALVGEYDAGDFRAGVFFSQYDDFIEYVQTTGINPTIGVLDPDGYRVPTNVDGVDMKGVELSGLLDLNKAFGWAEGFSTRAQAAYTKGESDDGDPVYSVQPFNLTWRLNFENPNGVWGASFIASHTSGKKDDDSYSTDAAGVVTYPLYLSTSVTVLDLIGYYDFGNSLRLTAGIYNLSDQEYYNWDSVRFVDQGDLRPGIGVNGDGIKRYSEPGRNFEMSVNYQF